jgi:golgi SNAP receptor complex member 2
MTSIGELFPKCRKLAYDARQQWSIITAIEQQRYDSKQQNNSNSNSNSNSHDQLMLLQCTIEELDRQLQVMDELVQKEVPAQRDVWKQKISELRYESQTIQQQQQQLTSRHSSVGGSVYAREREELLLRRRKRSNNTATASESDMNNLTDEGASLQQSSYMVGQILESGAASLHGLVEQRQRLRGVSRMVADMSHRLGLTQTTMQIIERRDITDAYFVAGGMIVTLIVLYLTWIM